MLTMKELRNRVPEIPLTNVMPPRRKTLVESGAQIVIRKTQMDITITVYANGYVLYEQEKQGTVFPFPPVGDYTYESVEVVSSNQIPADVLEEGDWFTALMMTGDDRIRSNGDWGHATHAVAYDTVGDDWLETVKAKQSLEDEILARSNSRRFYQGLACLTKKQREALLKYCEERMDYIQIGKDMGISRQGARHLVMDAVERLKKKCGLCVSDEGIEWLDTPPRRED